MKTLILYYSYSGNTRMIAQILQKEISADLAEIRTVTPYKGDYRSVMDQVRQEIVSGFLPEIIPIAVKIKDYGRIILGSPVWWYTFAPAVRTVLTRYNLSGKEIWPFATNSGRIGCTFSDFKSICAGAAVKNGLSVRFTGSFLTCSRREIFAWAKQIRAR